MSAVKIIFKRSSIFGKRPTSTNLEAGEIGLNTNATDPGLFFEVNNGDVVKVGPTSYLKEAPTENPSLGELWVDSDTKTLSIGTDVESWQKIAAPYLGGTNGLTVFVAPEYQNATDSISNDGQSVPFVTINRAIIEVTKAIINDTVNGFSLGNNRYQIILAPGQHCVVNSPGVSAFDFALDFSDPTLQVTQDFLRQFNPASVGGLIVPRGVSILGLDLKKCQIHPVYVPKYTYPGFPTNYTQTQNGPVYVNQPFSSVFRWSGNTYLSNFSGLDKIESRLVTQVFRQTRTDFAVFRTSRPHGLNYNDFVQMTYSDAADQVGATFTTGQYYVNPLNAFEFTVSIAAFGGSQTAEILWSVLPPSYFTTNISPDPKFQVSSIYPYFVPPTGQNYELHPYSHHRLSLVKNASVQELNDFYIKVQKAFPIVFGGRINTDLASPPEFEIVASSQGAYPNNLASNSTDNSSPYLNQVSVRSDYGMASGDFDGDIVSGFKSVIVNESTALTLQKDPVAYEVYSTAGQNWISLTAFTQQDLGTNPPLTSVPTTPQLQNLNEASIPNIRYFYDTVKVLNPTTQELQSTGIADPNVDFRHFGFRISGSNSFLQAQNIYTIGAAIACWARAGGMISLTGSTTNFGSVAMQSDGFAGIGTLGGANVVNKNFLLSGIVRPLELLESSVIADSQKRILYLGSKIVQVGIDPADPDVQQIYLQRELDPAVLLPFSLKPGSALFTSDSICTYRAFFVTDGTPTCILSGTAAQNPFSPGGAVLRVRFSDSTIPNRPSTTLDIPYIRRFIDPRTSSEKSYGFYIQSTNPTSQAPQLGSVLRLNQTGQSLSNTLKRNYQFDPGLNGGISQVFTVDAVQTEKYSVSPNFNYKVNDASQATNYVVYASVTDASSPWIQSVTVNNVLTPFNTPQGTFLAYQNRNYYAAENNLWSALYYQTTFNTLNGPTKVSPDDLDSPFVPTCVIEKSEPITSSWQGYVPDPYYGYYTTSVPDDFEANLSYVRGAVVPYTEISPQFQVDDDDSSEDLGIIYKRLPDGIRTTVLVAATRELQTAVAMTTPFVTNPTFGRPSVIELQLLSIQPIILPKEGVSILQLTNPTANPGVVEFVRVISVNSNIVQAIRNYYPEYSQGTLPTAWPTGTAVTVCVSSGTPEPDVYDPDWAVTKATMFRFFQLMGYSPNLMTQYLTPQYFGERILLNTSLPLSPVNGYANLTAAWPIEFNNPSSIIASNHTWQYAGYLDYSRGLPKFQVNEISRKLAYDYQSTTSWGGRLTVLGTNDSGQIVFSGPTTEALTAQYFLNDSPVSNSADRQIYQSPDPVTLPNPILVFSVDDISDEFDGVTTAFNLTRGGFGVPADQLSDLGVFVFLGGVVQIPGTAYSIQRSSIGAFVPQILFTEAPPRGLSCDIRIVTSEDDNATLEVVKLTPLPAFNGSASTFVLSPTTPSLSNLNSFIFLGGVEQNPSGTNQTSPAYTISNTTETQLTFVGGIPAQGTVFDMRGILSGYKYRQSGISTVFVSSVDDISPLFNNSRQTFPLLINNQPVDPTLVNAQNMFVSLGGVMQIPVAQSPNTLAGLAYEVKLNTVSNRLEITFATPPLALTTCNIRVITSEEYLTCPVPDSLTNNILEDGPGILVNENNQIIGIDPGLIVTAPTPPPPVTVTTSATTIAPGGAVNVTIDAPVPAGTTLFWDTLVVDGVIPATDFTDNTLVGTVTLNSAGTVTRTLKSGVTINPPESFRLRFRSGSLSGPVLGTSATVSLIPTPPPPPPPPPTYIILPSATTVNEGGTVVFTITTTNVATGTTLYWTTRSVSGSVVAGDFTDNTLSGSVIINSNTSTISRTIATDIIVEGTERFVIELHTGAITGPVVATSAAVTINDTPVPPPTPTYAISPSSNAVSEGGTVTFTVATTNVASGTTLFWTTSTVTGTIDANDFLDGLLSGPVTISNNTATIIRRIANGIPAGQSESFALVLHTGATTGPSVATSTAVIINDGPVPPPTPTYSITPDRFSVSEGQSVIFTVNTTNLPNGSPLFWTTNSVSGNVNAADFTDGAVAGQIVINNNVATITRTLQQDITVEPNEAFQIQIRTGATTGPIVVTSQNIAITDNPPPPPAPTYVVAASTTTVGEGNPVVFTITTTNVPDNTTLFWGTDVISGTVVAGDFTDNTLSGTVIINSNAATVTRTISADIAAETNESFRLEIRTISPTGTVVATSPTVSITDNPVPTYAIAPNVTTIAEGATVTFTVNTTNVNNGTILYWSTTGTGITNADFTDNITAGQFTVNANTGTIARTITNDAVAEGAENFQLRVHTGSTTGPTVATSVSVTITEAPPAPLTVNLTTSSFVSGGAIPAQFYFEENCKTGALNTSPALSWTVTGDASQIVSFALFCNDITVNFSHWNVMNIPSTLRSIAQNGAWPAGTQIDATGYSPQPVRANGWGGPCPDSPHSYNIVLVAFGAGGTTLATSNILTFTATP